MISKRDIIFEELTYIKNEYLNLYDDLNNINKLSELYEDFLYLYKLYWTI